MRKKIQKILEPEKQSSAKKSNRLWLWIFAAACISYGLSIFNEYALDDFIVIVKNKFTQAGFAGIWNILSHDSFAGMTDSNVAGLAGIRYRPLSLITFAIEHQLFGSNPFLSHLINVFLYACSGVLLFKWLILIKTTFSEKTWKQIAFTASLLFISLPVHSESVINIKGRDDLLCLLFFLLAAIQLFQYAKSASSKHLRVAALFFFLSLMSKETAITFLAAFPLMLFLLSESTQKKIITSSFLFGAMACLFLLFRFLATNENAGTMSEDVLNNHFADATSAQHYATIFLTWLLYFKLLIFPLHLSYDYNYNQIPLTDFSNPLVLLSIAIHVGLLVFAFYYFRRKPVYSFSILFYLITFSVVSNLFFNTGTPLAERFVFIPGIGFCLAIVAFFINAFEKLKLQKTISLLLITSVISFFTIRNILRCGDWKDNNTLFLADVKQTPNSAKSQLNAGIACLNLAAESTDTEKEKWINQSFAYLQKGINIYPKKIDGYINMGVAYSWKNDFENAELWWNKAKAINPLSPELITPNKVLAEHYFKQGMKLGSEKYFIESINTMLHALQYDSANAEILFNLGGAYFTIQNADSAVFYFEKALLLSPTYPNATEGLNASKILQSAKKSH